MKLTDAVLKAMRENRDAAHGNTAVLYSEVCKIMGIVDPSQWPNPGSVARIGLRYRDYGLSLWRKA